MKLTIQLFILILVLAALPAHTATTQALTNLALVLTPPFPAPEEEVAARAVLTGADQALSSFEWYVNNRLNKTASGFGKNTFSFRVGNDAKTSIDIVVITQDGSRLSATKTITRERPRIIWWTDTSVPAWYQGKALPSPGSIITVMALPGAGFGEKPSALLYSWSVNVEPRPEISGIGKNSFTLKTSLAQGVNQQINVRISNTAQTIAQETAIMLPTVKTEVFVYRLASAGLTDFSRAVSLFAGRSGETHDFIAVPFFFRSDQIASLRYAWLVNGREIAGDEKPNILNLKTVQGQTSQNTITAKVLGSGINAQEAEYVFSANFN